VDRRYWIGWFIKSGYQLSKEIPIPLVSEIPHIPSEEAEFFNVSGSGNYPKFVGKLMIDPFENVEEGEPQYFSIWAEDPKGIKKVIAKIGADKGDKIIELQFIEGTKENGKWQGFWEVEDVSMLPSYATLFQAINNQGDITEVNVFWKTKMEDSSNRKKFNFLGLFVKGVRAETGQVWQSCQTGTLIASAYTTYFMGYKFRPQTDGQVTKLCGYWPNATALVKLQNASYDVIASQTVTSVGHWSCQSIPPVDVIAGQDYYVGAKYYGYYQGSPGLPKTCNDVYIHSSCYQSNIDKFTSPICQTNYMYGQVDVVFITGPFFNAFQNVSGDYTVNSDCYIEGEKGIEGGDLTIASGVTLQINKNSSFIFNEGQSIFIEPNAYILKSDDNSNIKKGHIVVVPDECDSDSDCSSDTSCSGFSNTCDESGTYTNYYCSNPSASDSTCEHSTDSCNRDTDNDPCTALSSSCGYGSCSSTYRPTNWNCSSGSCSDYSCSYSASCVPTYHWKLTYEYRDLRNPQVPIFCRSASDIGKEAFAGPYSLKYDFNAGSPRPGVWAQLYRCVYE